MLARWRLKHLFVFHIEMSQTPFFDENFVLNTLGQKIDLMI